jgi:hypothetical protein
MDTFPKVLAVLAPPFAKILIALSEKLATALPVP